MKGLFEKWVDPSLLKGGLFFFNCSKWHALNPDVYGMDMEWLHESRYWKRFWNAHRMLREELILAEKTGRVEYRRTKVREWRMDRFKLLQQFLLKNGLPELPILSMRERRKMWKAQLALPHQETHHLYTNRSGVLCSVDSTDGYTRIEAEELLRKHFSDLVEIVVY
jgi:hypothetical protein